MLRWTLLTLLFSSATVRAELVALDILERKPFAGGQSFGAVGPYDHIVGVARFAVDPSNPRNRVVVDLDKAPRNKDGKVEFESDVVILAPKDPSKSNGALFYDVNNRGNKLALKFFNYANTGNDIDKPGAEGDGFLLRHGFTVVWCGWLGEILPIENKMLLKPPIATENGQKITGQVRFEMSTDVLAPSMPISRREGHGSYRPTDAGSPKATLTQRLAEADTRQPIPREQWKFDIVPNPKLARGVQGTLDQVRIQLEGGFQPGILYELICECENPIVQGTSFLAVGDLVSFLRYDTSKNNPLLDSTGKSTILRTHAFGVSQSGRFLRHMLWQGFNVDEKNRLVFDGLIPHVAGGGLGYFNHRFAQPTRHNGQHEDHLYPNDVFPFAYETQFDPLSKTTDGILRDYSLHPVQPKVFHTQSAAEYWHRSGSLPHTDPLGKKDAVPPANVRFYTFGGTQHGPASDPPTKSFADNLNNPGDYRPYLRALILALDAWVKNGAEPPASRFPRIDNKTLVHWSQASTGFPNLPGLRYPTVIQQPVFADWGPEARTKGLITLNPPKVKAQYTVLVPKNDADGNDLGTLLPPEVAVPLATYTGWNTRRKDVGADGMLASLLGSYIPFASTKAEREKTGDPRLSLQERYGKFETYKQRFADECAKLAKDRLLTNEDVERLVGNRDKLKDRFAP